jgi:hypothetical protein
MFGDGLIIKTIQYDDIPDMYIFEFVLWVVAMETNVLHFTNVSGKKVIYVAIATKLDGN